MSRGEITYSGSEMRSTRSEAFREYESMKKKKKKGMVRATTK